MVQALGLSRTRGQKGVNTPAYKLLYIVTAISLVLVCRAATLALVGQGDVLGCVVQSARDRNGDNFVLCRGTVGNVLEDERGIDGAGFYQLRTSRSAAIRLALPPGLSPCVVGNDLFPRAGQRVEIRASFYDQRTIGICNQGSYIKYL